MSAQLRLRDAQTALSNLQAQQSPIELELLKIRHEKEMLAARVALIDEEIQV